MTELVSRWSPRLWHYAIGVGLGVIPSALAAIASVLYAQTKAIEAASLLQSFAWLFYCGAVLGAIFCMGSARRRYIGYGMLTIVILTAIVGSYNPLTHPSI